MWIHHKRERVAQVKKNVNIPPTAIHYMGIAPLVVDVFRDQRSAYRCHCGV